MFEHPPKKQAENPIDSLAEQLGEQEAVWRDRFSKAANMAGAVWNKRGELGKSLWNNRNEIAKNVLQSFAGLNVIKSAKQRHEFGKMRDETFNAVDEYGYSLQQDLDYVLAEWTTKSQGERQQALDVLFNRLGALDKQTQKKERAMVAQILAEHRSKKHALQERHLDLATQSLDKEAWIKNAAIARDSVDGALAWGGAALGGPLGFFAAKKLRVATSAVADTAISMKRHETWNPATAITKGLKETKTKLAKGDVQTWGTVLGKYAVGGAFSADYFFNNEDMTKAFADATAEVAGTQSADAQSSPDVIGTQHSELFSASYNTEQEARAALEGEGIGNIEQIKFHSGQSDTIDRIIAPKNQVLTGLPTSIEGARVASMDASGRIELLHAPTGGSSLENIPGDIQGVHNLQFHYDFFGNYSIHVWGPHEDPQPLGNLPYNIGNASSARISSGGSLLLAQSFSSDVALTNMPQGIQDDVWAVTFNNEGKIEKLYTLGSHDSVTLDEYRASNGIEINVTAEVNEQAAAAIKALNNALDLDYRDRDAAIRGLTGHISGIGWVDMDPGPTHNQLTDLGAQKEGPLMEIDAWGLSNVKTIFGLNKSVIDVSTIDDHDQVFLTGRSIESFGGDVYRAGFTKEGQVQFLRSYFEFHEYRGQYRKNYFLSPETVANFTGIAKEDIAKIPTGSGIYYVGIQDGEAFVSIANSEKNTIHSGPWSEYTPPPVEAKERGSFWSGIANWWSADAQDGDADTSDQTPTSIESGGDTNRESDLVAPEAYLDTSSSVEGVVDNIDTSKPLSEYDFSGMEDEQIKSVLSEYGGGATVGQFELHDDGSLKSVTYSEPVTGGTLVEHSGVSGFKRLSFDDSGEIGSVSAGTSGALSIINPEIFKKQINIDSNVNLSRYQFRYFGKDTEGKIGVGLESSFNVESLDEFLARNRQAVEQAGNGTTEPAADSSAVGTADTADTTSVPTQTQSSPAAPPVSQQSPALDVAIPRPRPEASVSGDAVDPAPDTPDTASNTVAEAGSVAPPARFETYEIKSGDNIWNILREELVSKVVAGDTALAHFSKDSLSDAQIENMVGNMAAKILDNPSTYTSFDDFNSFNVGGTIDMQKVYDELYNREITVDGVTYNNLAHRAANLTSEQVANINQVQRDIAAGDLTKMDYTYMGPGNQEALREQLRAQQPTPEQPVADNPPVAPEPARETIPDTPEVESEPALERDPAPIRQPEAPQTIPPNPQAVYDESVLPTDTSGIVTNELPINTLPDWLREDEVDAVLPKEDPGDMLVQDVVDVDPAPSFDTETPIFDREPIGGVERIVSDLAYTMRDVARELGMNPSSNFDSYGGTANLSLSTSDGNLDIQIDNDNNIQVLKGLDSTTVGVYNTDREIIVTDKIQPGPFGIGTENLQTTARRVLEQVRAIQNKNT